MRSHTEPKMVLLCVRAPSVIDGSHGVAPPDLRAPGPAGRPASSRSSRASLHQGGTSYWPCRRWAHAVQILRAVLRRRRDGAWPRDGRLVAGEHKTALPFPCEQARLSAAMLWCQRRSKTARVRATSPSANTCRSCVCAFRRFGGFVHAGSSAVGRARSRSLAQVHGAADAAVDDALPLEQSANRHAPCAAEEDAARSSLEEETRTGAVLVEAPQDGASSQDELGSPWEMLDSPPP